MKGENQMNRFDIDKKMLYKENCGTSHIEEDEMDERINYQFQKHYGRIIEDLKQIKGFTPVMEKVISFGVSKLQEDIENEITKGENYAIQNDKKNSY